MQRIVVVIAVLVAAGLAFACLPPPAASRPSPAPAAEPADVAQCVLSSAAAVALSALPAPSAVIASAPLINDALAQSYESLQPVLRSEPPPPPAVASGSDLVDTARRYRGVRYRWAGMSSRGMDCSGLIARVLRANGVRAPHNAAQLFKLGETVRFRDLRPGDLLFFKTSRRGISHVGMYVGEDKFIHASSGAGRVVTTSIYDPYYSKRLKGARRLGETSE